jgi:hypothetical protein
MIKTMRAALESVWPTQPSPDAVREALHRWGDAMAMYARSFSDGLSGPDIPNTFKEVKAARAALENLLGLGGTEDGR